MKKIIILLSLSLAYGCSPEKEELIVPLANESARTPGSDDTPPSIPVEDNGLVAYYPFTGNANDHSAGNRHGVVHGATLTTDRHGNPDQAYYFDGVNDSISIANDAVFHFNKSFSFSVWVREEYWVAPYSHWHSILSFNAKGQGRKWGLATGSDLIGFFGDASAKKDDHWNYFEWQMITVVVDAESSSISLYENGKLVSERNLPAETIDYSDPNHALMMGAWQGGFFFHGKIDEVKIYSRKFNARGVYHLYEVSK